jgi:hypothetical protein
MANPTTNKPTAPPDYDYSVSYESEHTLYALILNPVDGTAWNGAAFVDPAGAAWPTCADAMVDDGAGTYSGTFPASLPPGTYLIQSYLQVGAAPLETDPLTGTNADVSWPGSITPSPDYSVEYPSGLTVYALVLTNQGLAWNGTAFTDPDGNHPACAVAMAFNAETGRYEGSIPSGVPSGTYLVQSYLQVGASPADIDPAIGFSYVPWGAGIFPATTALFEKALVADLKLNAIITGIVAGRVFPRKRSQPSSLPALVYDIGQKTHERHLDGPNGIARCRVIIHCMSRRAIDAKACAEQLRYRFDGFSGLLGAVEIVESWLSNDPDDYEPNDDGSDAGTFSVPCAFLFRYRETIPVR